VPLRASALSASISAPWLSIVICAIFATSAVGWRPSTIRDMSIAPSWCAIIFLTQVSAASTPTAAFIALSIVISDSA